MKMNKVSESASQWLIKKLKEFQKYYVLSALYTLLSAGSFVLFAWYLSVFAADWLNQGKINAELLLFASVFLLGRYLFSHIASVTNNKTGNSVIERIKKEIYPHLLHDNQLDSTSSALYLTKISDDLKPFSTFYIPYALASVLVSLVVLIVCFFVDRWVGIILLISMSVIPIQMIVVGIGAENLHQKHINLFLNYSSVFYNRLQAIAEIVNLDNFNKQHDFLDRKGKELNTATTKVMRVAMLSSALLELFVTLCIAAVAIYLGMSLLGIMPGPNYGLGYNFRDALFLLVLSPYFFFYIRNFVSAYHDRNRALASARLLMPVYAQKDSKPDRYTDEPLCSIAISNLNFAYPGSPQKVLHDISVPFPQKMSGLIWVKGISGSGKSTLLKICAGHLRPQQGLVSINNQNNEWSQQWLRNNTAYMNQYPFMFEGTVKYNVFLDTNSASESDCPAFLDKIVKKKPQGWETVMTHNGKQFSGGERQLITLARLLVHPKPIVILDEPTANLDEDTIRQTILPVIAQLAQEKWVILASHEPLFEQIADETLTLNWGEQMNSDE